MCARCPCRSLWIFCPWSQETAHKHFISNRADDAATISLGYSSRNSAHSWTCALRSGWHIQHQSLSRGIQADRSQKPPILLMALGLMVCNCVTASTCRVVGAADSRRLAEVHRAVERIRQTVPGPSHRQCMSCHLKRWSQPWQEEEYGTARLNAWPPAQWP